MRSARGHARGRLVGGLYGWWRFCMMVVLGFRVPWRVPDPRHSSWCPEKTPRSCNASSGDPPIRDLALSWKHRPLLTTMTIRPHIRAIVTRASTTGRPLAYPLRVHFLSIGPGYVTSNCLPIDLSNTSCYAKKLRTWTVKRWIDGVWSPLAV